MGAKTSEAMLQARELITRGATPYRAAKDCGLTVSAITRSQWHIDFQAAQPVPDPNARTPQERAKWLIIQDGKTAYEAAKLTGVAQSTISRSAWYREFIENSGGKDAA
jgi:hypothetical protein